MAPAVIMGGMDQPPEAVDASPSGPLRRFAREVADALFPLLKVMIPVALVVRLLGEWGLVEMLASITAPAMALVGLPGEMGLAWAAALLTGLYGGLAAWAELAPNHPLTVGQLTVLFVIMLTAHGLPLECAIARQAGLRLRWTIGLRLGAALAFGWLHAVGYNGVEAMQAPAPAILFDPDPDPGWGAWALGLGRQVLLVAAVIVGLLLVLKLLRLLRIEAALAWLLRPVLRLVGIRREAMNMTLVGNLLGLSYGGGLLIKEARAGHLDRGQVLLAMSFLCLCHSQLEDTVLMIALGGHWSGVAVGRAILSLAVIAILARCIARWPALVDRWLMRPIDPPPAPEPTHAVPAS